MADLRTQLHHATGLLAQCSIDSPRLSAELLLAKTLKIDRQELLKQLIINPQFLLSQTQEQLLLQLVSRRSKGEPIAYILGEKEFFSRSFIVTPATLIPRPETELLVETVIGLAYQTQSRMQHNTSQPFYFADLGTGSGCIAITVSLALPQWRGFAVDKSRNALSVAKANALAHKASGLSFIEADFHGLPFGSASFSLIVANPPYVSESEYQSLSHEVRKFEPRAALVPHLNRENRAQKLLSCSNGLAPPKSIVQKKTTPSLYATGLEDFAGIIRQASILIQPSGYLVFEIGHKQGPLVTAMFQPYLWTAVKVIPDFAGHDRIVLAQKIAK